jgi:hypothetical protein
MLPGAVLLLRHAVHDEGLAVVDHLGGPVVSRRVDQKSVGTPYDDLHGVGNVEQLAVRTGISPHCMRAKRELL